MRPTQRFFAVAALVLIALGVGQALALRGDGSSAVAEPEPEVAGAPEPSTDAQEPSSEPEVSAEETSEPTPVDEKTVEPTPSPSEDSGDQVASSGSGSGSQGAPPPSMPTTGAPVSHWSALGAWLIASGSVLLSLRRPDRRLTPLALWATRPPLRR